jgi:hypothetical protein
MSETPKEIPKIIEKEPPQQKVVIASANVDEISQLKLRIHAIETENKVLKTIKPRWNSFEYKEAFNSQSFLDGVAYTLSNWKPQVEANSADAEVVSNVRVARKPGQAIDEDALPKKGADL